MRALLVNPSQLRAYGVRLSTPYPPLGLLYIAAVLRRAGVEPTFIDADLAGRQGVAGAFATLNPDLVALTATTPVFSDAEALAWQAARIAPKALRIIGGPHATADPEGVLRSGAFHAAAIGEGEETVAELVGRLRLRPSETDLEGIRGLWFRRRGDGTIVRNPRRPLISDLDNLPRPARDLLPSLASYSPPDARRSPVATIMASRGCPGRCTFCCSPAAFGGLVRYRSVGDVVAEIGEAIDRHGAREIHFADDSLTEDRQWTLELCEALHRSRFPVDYMFMNGLRVDRVDRELLESLRSIGMQNVGFGIESGSPRILANLRKGIDLDQAFDTIQLAKALGFATWCYFLFGSPGETDDTALATIDFAKRANPDFAKFFVFKPFPGTRAYRELAASGHLVRYDPDRTGIYTAPVHRVDEMEPERMMYWLRRANREFYLRPGKVIDHLRRIRSLTQLRLNLRSLRFVAGMMLRAA
ncbi:MAG: hypothetical protein CME06_17670 [Gemmatimonadetes bacterium]|nr:hypothetical protein [Gemmatimonadota bacterium]